MPSDYPAFIFQDAIPAQQMMAHAQAVSEGQRIQELGKARQVEGMLRMAQMRQQQKASQEKNELDRMLAMSQIQQNKISQDFRERELAQRGTLEAERNKNYAERSKLEFSPDRMFPQEALLERKIELEEEDRKRAEAAELGLVTEAERALMDLDRKSQALGSMETNDPDRKYINPPVIQSHRNSINLQRKDILDGMKKKGYDYDPTSRKFIGVNRGPVSASQLENPVNRPGVNDIGVGLESSPATPSIGGGLDLMTGKATMTPFDMQVRGLQPGSQVQQGGATFGVTPQFPATPPPSVSSMTGDATLNEYSRRYPGVNFVRDGDTIRPGGYDWDDSMRRIAEDPNIAPQAKSQAIMDYIRRKYPGLFQGSGQDAFERYVPAAGRVMGGMLQNLLPSLGR